MAPGAHHLVLRDVPAGAEPGRLRRLRPQLRLPLQLVLRGRRARVTPGSTGASCRGPASLEIADVPHPRRRGHGRPARRRPVHRRQAGAAGPARAPPRAAAPGAAAHGHQARPVGATRCGLRTAPAHPGCTRSPARLLRRSPGSRDRGAWSASGSAGDGFSYDNERPRHEALLQAHEVAGALVTAGDWLAFMADGGYAAPELWLSDGWATVQAESWEAPLYWEPDGAGWSVFTLGGLVPVDPTAPVVPRELVRGRRLRPLVGSPAPDRGRVGAGGPRARPTRHARGSRRLVRAGVAVDRQPPTRPTRASHPTPGRSASTTASSW